MSTLTLLEAARLALALFQQGDYVEAERLCQLILGAQPDNFDALHLNGAIAIRNGKPLEGIDLLSRATSLRPEQAQAHNNLGAALAAVMRFDAAIASYDHALSLDPRYVDAHRNRGVALGELGQCQAALECFDRALEFAPTSEEAHFGRGATLQSLRRYQDALRSYDEAIGLNPRYVEALFNKGAVLAELKRYESARDTLGRALQIDPDYPFLYGSWLQAKMRVCDWADIAGFESLEQKVRRGERAATPGILAMSASPAVQKAAAETWTRAKFPVNDALAALPPPGLGDRIRIGYFSSDFHHHPVALLTAGLLETHDRSRFEVTAFSSGPETGDEIRNRIKGGVENFVDAEDLSDRDLALLARARGIDIAVDLGGHTAGSRTRTLAMRAAPVQVSYLGYLGTMGASYIDYLIADATIVPAASRPSYTESIAYLPSYQANDAARQISDRRFTREELGLPERGFVFCCFNNSYKITPKVFTVWMRILQRVAGSTLFLYAENASVKDNLRIEAARRDVDPDRLVFGSRLPLADYIARYRMAGLFLDTAPYNAGTTASDALWAGLPVLTCAGDTFAGRVAASLLTSLGLPELIALTPFDYEERAVSLAHDAPELRDIRQKLEQRRLTSPLFDTVTFARHIEAVYTKMHERCMAGLPPGHIDAPG